MPMPAIEVVPGRAYVSDRSGGVRIVVEVVGDEVLYRTKGVLSFVPFRASLEDFASWADRIVSSQPVH